MAQIQFKKNWDETIKRFDDWFQHKNTGRPLLNILAKREKPLFEEYTVEPFDDDADSYLNVEKNYARIMNEYNAYEPVAEAFPQFSMNLGAGSMALYLGASPKFAPDTIWFQPCIEDYTQALPLHYDPDNIWWVRHQEILRRQVKLAKNSDLMVCIPDIVENIDILCSMRDSQTCCFDFYDYPDELRLALKNIEDTYMQYYDPIYNIVKTERDCCSYTAFNILGTGKTAKIQCDCSVLLSPSQYEEYILPSLARQCDEIKNTLYHLDGPDCLVHVDAIMKLDKLDALQWTPGFGNDQTGSEKWFPLYKTVKEHGKGLWIGLKMYELEEAIYHADQIVKAVGPEGIFFNFPKMDMEDAKRLIDKAETQWRF